MTLQNVHKFSETQVRKRQGIILNCISAGMSGASACNRANVSYGLFKAWLRDDSSFIERYQWAYDQVTDYLEELAFEKAHEDTSILKELLKARRPEVYNRGTGGGAGGSGIQVVIQTNFGGEQVEAKPVFEAKVVEDRKLLEGDSDSDGQADS